MKLKSLMSIKSVICWVFGVAFILVPVQVLSIYGITVTAGGALMAQLLGASFILLALWLGLAREAEDATAKRAVAIAVAVGDLIGAAVMIYALVSGVGNALGWANVVLYLLLAVGFGYTLLAEPEGKLAI